MPMPGRIPSGRAATQLARASIVLVALSGCAGGGKGSGDSGKAATGGTNLSSGVFSERPRVPISAAESHPGPGIEQLDFFDSLERTDLVSHDDALHASLLLFTGQSGQTFVQRAARAKQVGMLDAKYDRPPREAATIGELARLLAGGMHRASRTSEAQATADMKQLGVIPETAAANVGLTGAQLLTILGHAEDAMASLPEAAPAPPAGRTLRPFTPAERAWAGVAVFAAQPVGAQPVPGDKKPVRKPPIDLEKDAKKPRPGQVLPDNAAPAPGDAPPPKPEDAAKPDAPKPPAANPSDKPGDTPTAAPRGSPALRPPKAEGAVPSRVDGVASQYRYVAVDRVTVNAKQIMGPGEFVQWRAVDDGRGHPGPWQTLTAGTPIDDRVEIRTGLGVRATMTISDSASVVLHRLSRIRVERKIRSDGQAQIGVMLYRGMVEVAGLDLDQEGLAKSAVLVRTPDQTFPLRTRALFEYDAFAGTQAREFRR